MLEGLTKRDVVIALLAILAATVLTIEGAYYGLHRFVLDNPNDPLTRQGGLNPSQRVKERKAPNVNPQGSIQGSAS
jgi:hypothetical protein